MGFLDFFLSCFFWWTRFLPFRFFIRSSLAVFILFVHSLLCLSSQNSKCSTCSFSRSISEIFRLVSAIEDWLLCFDELRVVSLVKVLLLKILLLDKIGRAFKCSVIIS